MDSVDSSEVFCMLLQNPNGICPFSTDMDFKYSLAKCSSFGIGSLSLVEMKLNWNKTGILLSAKKTSVIYGNTQYYNPPRVLKLSHQLLNLVVLSQQ